MKVHYADKPGTRPVCRNRLGHNSTNAREQVTCARCLEALKRRDEKGHGDLIAPSA
jgi:hypothetical protein